MILGFSGVNYTGWLYIARLPGYLQAQQGLSPASYRLGGGDPVSCRGGGDVGQRHGGRCHGAQRLRSGETRKTAIVIGLVLSALGTLLVVQSSTPARAVAFISMALFCVHFAGTSARGWCR